jgi:chromosome segregation ATPase
VILQEQLENIQNETKQLLEELDTVTIERRALDEKKSALDNELEAKLIRQRDTLLARLTDMGVDEKRHDLELSRNELAHMAEKIKEASTRLASELQCRLYTIVPPSILQASKRTCKSTRPKVNVC